MKITKVYDTNSPDGYEGQYLIGVPSEPITSGHIYIHLLYKLEKEDDELFLQSLLNPSIRINYVDFFMTDDCYYIDESPMLHDKHLFSLINTEINVEGDGSRIIEGVSIQKINGRYQLILDFWTPDDCEPQWMTLDDAKDRTTLYYTHRSIHYSAVAPTVYNNSRDIENLLELNGYYIMLDTVANAVDAYKVFEMQANKTDNQLSFIDRITKDSAHLNIEDDRESAKAFLSEAILFCDVPRLFDIELEHAIGSRIKETHSNFDNEFFINGYSYITENASFYVNLVYADDTSKHCSIEINQIYKYFHLISEPIRDKVEETNNKPPPNDVVSYQSDGTDELLEFLREDQAIQQKEIAATVSNTEGAAMHIRNLLNEAQSIMNKHDELRMTISNDGCHVIEPNDINIELLTIRKF